MEIYSTEFFCLAFAQLLIVILCTQAIQCCLRIVCHKPKLEQSPGRETNNLSLTVPSFKATNMNDKQHVRFRK